MSDWYSPNQQAVRADGSGAAEEGSGGTGAPPLDVSPPPYDPGAHTVAEVQEYVTAHADERATVLAAEQAGRNRVSLVEWLNAA